MPRSLFGFAKVSLGCLAIALAASPAQTQQAAAPIARYTIDVGTSSGLMAMASGGGIGAAMAMMRGGNQVAHEMVLQLGSTRGPTGEAKGDHFLPTGMRMGASLPLLTTPRGRTTPVPEGPGTRAPDQQMPTGRLLLFWGCGERAGPGQPVIIDFSKLARGQVPPGLYAQSLNLPDDWTVSSGNTTTFGEWPNGRNPQQVPANASLLGEHRIASTYAPEIKFTLNDDFMPALNPVTREMPSGAIGLSWTGAPKATGYYAWAIGSGAGGNSRDMVWWTSSSTQQFGGPMSDWISPSAAARLVQAGTVMAPSRTTCTIPAEVKQAGGEALMTQLFGYGPQADFAYPPRPADARTPWRPEWIARVRFRSQAMVIPGMPGMGGGEEEEVAPRGAQADPAPRGKPRCSGGLRGRAERAAGLCE